MRFLIVCILLLFILNVNIHSQGFIIDRNSIKLFDSIPDSYLESARNTKLMFSDRSVGQNINEALDYFEAASWETSPASARRDYIDTLWNTKLFTKADWDAGLVPDRIKFNPDPVKYNRSNWIFVFRQGTWNELTKDFIDSLAPQYIHDVDVLTYQFSYLNVLEGDDIADPVKGFFANVSNRSDVFDLEKYLQMHTNKKFFYWTTSLARGIGTKTATDFNNAMRNYCIQNNKVLFDMADIISHTDRGVPCYDNRDGIPFKTENHPDDGFAFPAICQDYTSELEGGHLGNVSAGKIMMAKAFWVMMAKLAGWQQQPVSSKEAKQVPFTIFPNPAKNSITIHLSNRSDGADIQITMRNTCGITCYQSTFHGSDNPNANIEISTESLPDGMYFLTLNSKTNNTSSILTILH
jgi:hypothetical protein